MAKDNISKTDTEQLLLDIVTAISKSNISSDEKMNLSQKVAELSDMLPTSIMESAEAIFRQRQYKNCSYCQSPTLAEHPHGAVLLDLNESELKVFTLIRIMMVKQHVQLSHSVLEEVLQLSRSTVKRVMSSLVDKGILIPEVPATNREAAIYRVNSAVLRVGKQKTTEADLKLLAPDYMGDEKKFAAFVEKLEKKTKKQIDKIEASTANTNKKRIDIQAAVDKAKIEAYQTLLAFKSQYILTTAVKELPSGKVIPYVKFDIEKNE